MDNPEEVLQALDEFSKMRPSEIPRELEDYLCFVAKTGDPVYQWSLIKPLFREKLVRVMTDFYENCPALDLASSPNIEHFNYDIMKCNLLELLESFASAPFTVQRICELLTSPRKEYNRVDKFMRAIEKNILVVSTKEPGPAARRSENGESMLNGSIDDDNNMTPNNQSSQEVEMESWVKDCTTPDANSSSLTSSDHDQSLVETILPSNKILTKDLNNSSSIVDDNLTIHDNNKDQSSRLEMTVSSFISAAHDMSNTPITSAVNDTIAPAATITTTTTTSTTTSTTTTATTNNNNNNQNNNNISNATDQVSTIANDVPEGIINEDTSSQPSLDSENDDSESSNINKKLQTTFQSKDFPDKISDEISDKFYTDNDKIIIESSIKNDDSSKCIDDKSNPDIKDYDSKSGDESKSSYDSNLESGSPEKRPRLDNDSNDDLTDNRNFSVVTSQEKVESNDSKIVSDTTKCEKFKDTENLIDKNYNENENEKETELKSSDLNSQEIQTQSTLFITEQSTEFTSNDSTDNSEKSSEDDKNTQERTDDPQPIIEEPPVESSSSSSSSSCSSSSSPTSLSNDYTQENLKADKKSSSVIIQEAMDDDSKLFNNSSVNDPVPIVEEPKDELVNINTNTAAVSQLEVSDYTKTDAPTDANVNDNDNDNDNDNSAGNDDNKIQAPAQTEAGTEELKVEDNKNLVNLDSNSDATIESNNDLLPTVPEFSSTPMEKEESMETESMEVDSEEPGQVFQQDEPMEQESGDQITS